jgi:MFS family permease
MTALTRSFTPLRNADFRRWFAGQVVSLSGNWMQMVGELWLVLSLTGSALAVGLVPALQFAPVLVAAPFGGVLVDRLPKRPLLLITQAAMSIPALILFFAVEAGIHQVWLVYVLVFVRGSINAIDNPARQAFLPELVGTEEVPRAIALNSALVSSARIFGPALAGLSIATLGVAPCFLANAVSFAAVLIALMRMQGPFRSSPPVPRSPGQLKAGLRYAWTTPELRTPLLVLAVVSTFSFNFQTLLPLLAQESFHGGGGTYGLMTSAMGAGSIVGALGAASRARPTRRLLLGASAALGVLMLAMAFAPTLGLEFGVLLAAGVFSIIFSATANSLVQVAVDPAMRGRIMALYAMVFLGSTPIGAPIIGWMAAVSSPRVAIAFGGAAAIAAAAAPVLARRTTPVAVAGAVPEAAADAGRWPEARFRADDAAA